MLWPKFVIRRICLSSFISDNVYCNSDNFLVTNNYLNLLHLFLVRLVTQGFSKAGKRVSYGSEVPRVLPRIPVSSQLLQQLLHSVYYAMYVNIYAFFRHLLSLFSVKQIPLKSILLYPFESLIFMKSLIFNICIIIFCNIIWTYDCFTNC